MKIDQALHNFVFKQMHNYSEFANFCLLIFLVFLFFTFMHGLREQLEEKIAYQKRKFAQRRNQMMIMKQPQQQTNSSNSSVTGNTSLPPGSTPVQPGSGSFTSQQPTSSFNEQQLGKIKTLGQRLHIAFNKQILQEQLVSEENAPESFKFIKDHPSINAIVLQKDDVENPIFRVDLLAEKIHPKQIFEVLKDQLGLQNWFGKAVQSKLHSVASQDGSEIFSTIYKCQYPLNNREFIHRRLINCDDSKSTYIFNFTTLGLESLQSKQKQKYSRAYHSLCGIILRPGLVNEKGETVGTKIFYITQMEFAGQYVPVSAQIKAVPSFMLELLEKLLERAQKVKM